VSSPRKRGERGPDARMLQAQRPISRGGGIGGECGKKNSLERAILRSSRKGETKKRGNMGLDIRS